MKTATITELKKELQLRSREEIMAHCLAMARFKLEVKEYLTYRVFESSNEEAYIRSVKGMVSSEFQTINTTNYYYIKKSVRKILRRLKLYIRFSKKKETEAELLIHFCTELKAIQPSFERNRVLKNVYAKQLEMAVKAIDKLHPDLQYDFNLKIEDLTS